MLVQYRTDRLNQISLVEEIMIGETVKLRVEGDFEEFPLSKFTIINEGKKLQVFVSLTNGRMFSYYLTSSVNRFNFDGGIAIDNRAFGNDEVKSIYIRETNIPSPKSGGGANIITEEPASKWISVDV